MIYLFIVLALAALGIARLWLQQRKEQARLFSVAEFRTGLDTMGSQSLPQVPASKRTVPVRKAPRRTQPLDPARRAAAKARLEARRAEQRYRAAG